MDDGFGLEVQIGNIYHVVFKNRFWFVKNKKNVKMFEIFQRFWKVLQLFLRGQARVDSRAFNERNFFHTPIQK